MRSIILTKHSDMSCRVLSVIAKLENSITCEYIVLLRHWCCTNWLIYLSFFSGCHLFIPLFDPVYDTYESLKERTPWTFDAILAIASKIRSGNGALTNTFYRCLEEAQGIARSSLFGPVVRKEAVQGSPRGLIWSGVFGLSDPSCE